MGGSSIVGDLRTPQFNGIKDDLWAVKMETILLAYDLWDAVEFGIQSNSEVVESKREGDETKDLLGKAHAISKEGKIKKAKALILI